MLAAVSATKPPLPVRADKRRCRLKPPAPICWVLSRIADSGRQLLLHRRIAAQQAAALLSTSTGKSVRQGDPGSNPAA